jgi:hypothetical protein
MKIFALALLALGVAPGLDQDGTPTREVRIYLLDRATPDRNLKDAVAVLTIEQQTGRGKTFLLPRVAKGTPTPGEDRAPGLIRGVPPTPYFVELQTGEAAAAEPARAEQAPEKGKEETAGPPPGREVLERIHRHGVYFARKIPAQVFSGSWTATVTIRLGNLTFLSEEFQGPAPAGASAGDVAAKVDQSLVQLRTKAQDQVGFMELKPTAVRLRRELGQLAPAGFEDGSGEFERHRQWCLALARRIDDAVDRGENGIVIDLSQQCGPRVGEMQSILTRMRKETAPPPADVPPVK